MGVVGSSVTLIGSDNESIDVEIAHERPVVVDLIAEIDDTVTGEDVGDLLAGVGLPLSYLDPDFAQVGDVVTITMGDTVVTHVLTEQDFINLANCLGLADTLAVIEGLFGDAATLDDGVITIEGATSVSFTRLSHQELGLTKGILQEATAADDTEIDVYVRAALGAEATDTVMDLTIAGRGDFDLALELNDEGDSAFTDLALTLGDTHSHYVDTGGGAFSVVSNFLDLGYTESDFENLTTGVVEVVTLYGEVYRVGPAIDVSEVSDDGGESFEEWDPAPGDYDIFFDDFAAWLLGQENSGDIASARLFDGHPDEDGTLIVETVSVVSSVGGFENSITVTDAEGVDTSGASIILDNVFAKTVTSTSVANLVIDQASVWEDLGWMADEGYEIAPINVTTGSGDDHLITLAQAAMAEGASIDLGTGTNTLSLDFGEDVVVDSFVNGIAVAEASEGEGATDLGDIDEVEEDGTKAFALTVGERVTGTIAADGDRDVFAVDVVAGQTYQFSVHSAGDDRSLDDGEVGDVKLRVYDEDFNRLDGVFESSDEDSFGDSYLGEARVFTADRTGVMYFEVEGYYDDDEEAYNSGSYSVEVTEAGTKLLAGLNYNGDLNRLEIRDDIKFVDGASATLDVPGLSGQVSELYFEDIWADDEEAIGTLTVQGTASTLLVESGDDLGEADNEHIVFEAVGVADLTFDIDDDLSVTLRGGELETFTAAIGDNAYIEIDGDLTPNLRDINVAAEDHLAMDIDNLHTGANVVAHANSDDGSSGDVSVYVENSTLGNILALYGVDEDSGNVSFRGDVTVGDISLLMNGDDDEEETDANGTVAVRYNTGSSMVVGNVENRGYVTEVVMEYNNDSTLVFGDFVQVAEDDANFDVTGNNVVDITTGDVSIVGDDANFNVNHNGRPSEAFDGDDGFAGTSLTFGTVDLLALSDTQLSFSVSGNRDDVFYANTEITMDGVNLRSVGDVLVEIGDSEVSEDLSGGFDGASNVSTDISLGDINAEACNEVYVGVSGNSGTHYPVTAGVIPNAFTDFARVIAGDMSLFSHDEYVDLYVHGNDRAEIKLAAEAGQKLVLGSRSDYAHVSLSYNFDTLIEVGELEVNGVSDTGVDFFGNVTTERDGPSMEIFTAGMSISGVGEDRGAHLIINENEYIEMTVNGDIDVSGGSYEVYLEVQENDGSDVHVNGSVELTGDGIVSALIDDNDDAEVLIADGVSVDGGQAFFDIQNNDDSVVRFGGLSALGETQAYLSVDNNKYSTVELFDDVALEAIERDADGTAISGGGVSLRVEDNKEGSDIAIGYDYDTETFKSVDIEAWLGAYVTVQNNDGTWVHLGNLDIVSHTGEASFTLNAAPEDMDWDEDDWENETTVGTVDMEAEVLAQFTIDVENPLDGEDGAPVVVVDDVTIDSGSGVNFYVYNEDAESVTLGDIEVDAGLGSNPNAVVNFEVDNTDGTESVDLDVSNSEGGNLNVTIDTMTDLNSLTLAGSTGNVSLSGDLGGDEDTGGFLLDLGGMTGSFSDDLDDLGGWSRNYNGSHVDTWDAEFEGTVTVEIGSGDLVYNAEVVTTDGEDTENSLEEQWTGTGWVSRNSADITPVVAVQWIGHDDITISYPEYPADQPDGEDDSNFDTVQFEQDGVSYRVQLTSKASDGEDGEDDADTQSQELSFASYADTGWQLFDDEDDFLAALGIDSVEVSGGQIKFYGPADGSGFLELSDAKLVYEDSEAVEKSLSLGKSDGDAAVDGIGQEEREIFQFVGDEIGNVVIGGFNADPFDTAFGRATDRLDFSGFAGVNGLDDLTFAIDDSDGFFADVIVDFVNDSYGEIRLVGVGELENAIDAVSGSIIF